MTETFTQNPPSLNSADLLMRILDELVNHNSVRIFRDETGLIKVDMGLEDLNQQRDKNREEEFLDTPRAAELLHHSVYWLCRKRNREKYGIKLYRMGGKNLFKKKEIMEMIQRNFEKRRGRPRRQENFRLNSLNGKLYDTPDQLK